MSNVKISTFPNASTPMGSGDVVTGLQGGVNVNFSQEQILYGQNGTTSGASIIVGSGLASASGDSGNIYFKGQYRGSGDTGGKIFLQPQGITGTYGAIVTAIAGTPQGVQIAGANAAAASNNPGSNITIQSGAGDGSGIGGAVNVKGGYGYTGGNVNFYAGNASTLIGGHIAFRSGTAGGSHQGGGFLMRAGYGGPGGGDGGSISAFGGSSDQGGADGNGGGVYFAGGSGHGAGKKGGNASFYGGYGTGGALSGNIYFKGYHNGGGDTGGKIFLQPQGITGTNGIIITNVSGDPFFSSAGGNLSLTGIPTSAAGLNTGNIWCDTTGGLNILKLK